MDRPWNLKAWKPSEVSAHDGDLTIDPQTVSQWSTVIQGATSKIKEFPYHPGNWALRASALLEIGYPELAAGDAYKAMQLSMAGLTCHPDFGPIAALVLIYQGTPLWVGDGKQGVKLDYLRQETERHLRKWQNKALLCLTHSLLQMGCYPRALTYAKAAAQSYPDDERFPTMIPRLEELSKKQEERGRELLQESSSKPWLSRRMQAGIGVYTVPYPWMTEDELKRPLATLEMANKELGKAVRRMCEIRRSTLDENHSDKDERDTMMGVFATRNVQAAEIVLKDRTVTGACDKPRPKSCENCFALCPISVAIDCCDAKFCSINCRDMALGSYHPMICDKDFSWLKTGVEKELKEEETDFLRHQLLLRFLAICVQDKTRHPLQQSRISWMTPNYNKHKDPFSIQLDIAKPLEMLMTLGVNVYEDHRFDTWVLRVISTRIMNNRIADGRDQRWIERINPFYSFFNHSCEPSAVCGNDDDSTTTVVVASRDIKKGEEITIAYKNTALRASWKERQESLQHWLGGPCLCTRCERERGQETTTEDMKDFSAAFAKGFLLKDSN